MCFLVYMQKNFFKKRYNFVVVKCKTTHSFSVPSIVAKRLFWMPRLQDKKHTYMWHKVFDAFYAGMKFFCILQGSGMSSCWWCVSCMQPYWIVEIKVDFVRGPLKGGEENERNVIFLVWQQPMVWHRPIFVNFYLVKSMKLWKMRQNT